MAFDSRIPLVVLPLAAGFLSSRNSLVDDEVALRWWAIAEIQAGVGQDEDEAKVPRLLSKRGGRWWSSPRRLWRSLAIPLMILAGRLHQPAVAKRSSILDLSLLWEPMDPEGRFCRQVLEYCWRLPAGLSSCESPQVHATGADVRDFVEACRASYRDLGEEERWWLAAYRTSGVIPKDVLIRDPDDSSLDPGQPKGPVPFPPDDDESEKLSRDKLVEVLNDSLHASLLSEAIQSPPEAAVETFSGLDLREPPMIRSDWAEIGRAVRDSKIARFDGTSLLPSRLFNMTMEQLALGEGPAADRIPVLGSKCQPMSLGVYAAFAERHRRAGRRSAVSFANWDRFGLDRSTEVPASVAERIRNASLEASDADMCGTINVNVRRLPRLHSLLPQRLTEALDLEAEVLRTQPFLWLGPIQSLHHHDEDATLYVQLSGHTDVLLVAQSHSDFYAQSHTELQRPRRTNVKDLRMDDPLLSLVPVFLLHLRPGDGLVFPGRSYHTFRGQSMGRIAVSFFFQPSWRGLESSKDSWYAREAGKEHGLQHLALRQLWLRSLVRLYEETGKGIFYQHAKNELL